MRMLFCAFRIVNLTLFALARCRLKWPCWSARRVFVDTCDKNRIRNCAKPSHRLPYGCLGWVARGDLVQFLPVQVRRGPSARGTDSGNLNGERLNQVGGVCRGRRSVGLLLAICFNFSLSKFAMAVWPHETLDGPRLVETLRNH